MSYRVYKYTNQINGKVYIGQTKHSLHERAQTGGENYRESSIFYRAIQKYGWNSFTPEIIADNLTLDEANILEEAFIAIYDSTNPELGYNLLPGGMNREMDDRSKRILSQKAKERYQDPTKNPMYGRKHSDESKRKMSECKTGEKNPMYGKRMSDEQKAMRSFNRGKHLNLSPERRNAIREQSRLNGLQNAKRIRCVEDGIEFHSQTEAAEHYGVKIASINGQLKGRQHTCCGKHFEYVV